MAFSWGQIRPAISEAIQIDGYRPIAMDTLPTAEVRWPQTGSQQIDVALTGVMQPPNWVEIGRQLRLYASSTGFGGLFVRRDTHDLEVLVLQALEGPLTVELMQRELDRAWDVQRPLPKLFDRFTLSDATKSYAKQVLGALEPNLAVAAAPAAAPQPSAAAPAEKPAAQGWDVPLDQLPQPSADAAGEAKQAQASAAPGSSYTVAISAALALIHLCLDLERVGSVVSPLVLVGVRGLDADLTAKLESSGGMRHMDKWAVRMESPFVSAIGVNGANLEVHGRAGVGSMDSGKLMRNLKYNLHVA
jgi:hypothetical protein